MELSIREENVKTKKKMIALEIPQSLYEEVLKECERLCLGTSAVVRLALIRYLENVKNS